jgi:hypothetical protein
MSIRLTVFRWLGLVFGAPWLAFLIWVIWLLFATRRRHGQERRPDPRAEAFEAAFAAHVAGIRDGDDYLEWLEEVFDIGDKSAGGRA